MDDTCILSNNMKFPSHEHLMTFRSLTIDHIQWQTSNNHTLYQSVTEVPKSTLYRNMRGFHRSFALGVACRQGTSYSSGHLISSYFGLVYNYVLLVETNPFPELVIIFPDYICTSNIPRHFLHYASRKSTILVMCKTHGLDIKTGVSLPKCLSYIFWDHLL